MVSDQLKQYLDTVKKGLVDAGWSESDVREAFQQMEKPISSPTTPVASSDAPHAPVKRLRIRFFVSVLISSVVVIIGGGAFLSWQENVGLVNKIVSGITHETNPSVSDKTIALNNSVENTTTNIVSNNTNPSSSTAESAALAIISPESSLDGIQDCGTNAECLSKTTENCTPARGTKIETIDTFGMVTTITYGYTLMSTKDIGGCSLALVLSGAQTKVSDETKERLIKIGLSEEQITNQEKITQDTLLVRAGNTGVCVFKNNSDLVEYFNVQKTITNNQEFPNATCTGIFFDSPNVISVPPGIVNYVTRDTSIRMDWPFVVEFVRSASNEVVIRLVPDKDTLCPTKEIDITESNSYSCKDSTYSFSIDKEHTTKDGIAFFAIHNK